MFIHAALLALSANVAVPVPTAVCAMVMDCDVEPEANVMLVVVASTMDDGSVTEIKKPNGSVLDIVNGNGLVAVGTLNSVMLLTVVLTVARW